MPKLQVVSDDGKILVDIKTNELIEDNLKIKRVLLEKLAHTSIALRTDYDGRKDNNPELILAEMLARDTELPSMGFPIAEMLYRVQRIGHYSNPTYDGVAFKTTFDKISIAMLMLTLDHCNELLRKGIVESISFELSKHGNQRNTLVFNTVELQDSDNRWYYILQDFKSERARRILSNASGKAEYDLTIAVANEYGDNLKKPEER